MKFLKKIFVVSLMSILILNVTNVNAMVSKEFGYTYEDVMNMTPSEFVDFVNRTVHESDLPFEEIKSRLNNIGIQLSDNVLQNTYSTSADVDLTLYSSHRGTEPYYYLTAGVTSKVYLNAEAGSEDLISVEWDPAAAEYYDTTTGQYTTYMDGSKRAKGIVLFNLQDKNLRKGEYAYASVRVKRKTGSKLDFQTKYVHTFDTTNFTWSIGGNVEYEQSTGIKGGMSFSVSGEAKQKSWQRFADNTLYF